MTSAARRPTADYGPVVGRTEPETAIGKGVGSRVECLENSEPIQSAEDLGKHHFVVLDDSFGQLAVKQWMDRQISTNTTVTKVNGMLPLIELCEAGLGLAALPRFAVTSGCSDLKEIYPTPEFLEHQLWVLTHRDLSKSTRIRITTEFLYRELKPFFQFIEAPGRQYCRGCIGARYLEI